uniref:Pentapeptide repeat-containing protein n=1 Tax=Candidatus Kentrum sp. LFY TaxID=2126342 RepID=A0A450UPD0_9GAMM|nr:MAG: Pentapeptide repeat-containing protein [Candidatus Kentron sp. LFY]
MTGRRRCLRARGRKYRKIENGHVGDLVTPKDKRVATGRVEWRSVFHQLSTWNTALRTYSTLRLLIGVNLVCAKLAYTRLTNADLEDADLEGVDLRAARNLLA